MDLYAGMDMEILPSLTGSVFRSLDDLLEGDAASEAVAFQGQHKGMHRCACLTDFLYAEVFGERYDARKRCLEYYQGLGKPLEEVITKEEIAERELVLLNSVRIAIYLKKTNLRVRWNEFRRIVFELSPRHVGGGVGFGR